MQCLLKKHPNFRINRLTLYGWHVTVISNKRCFNSNLLPLAEIVDSEASVLSVRGNILENGMPRFFRRLAEGVFDEEDLIYRTNELNQFNS